FRARAMSSTMYKKRSPACNSCSHPMCDVIVRNRPERALGFVVDSIVNFEQHFGKDCKEEVREMCLETVSKFGAGTPYERDERLLPVYRILAWYSKSMTPDEVYRGLFEKRLFHTCAQFYIDWAEVHLRRENWKLTAEIIFYAISTCGTYHTLLNYLKQVVDVRLAEQHIIAETVTVPPNSDAAHELQVRLAELPQVLPHMVGPFIGYNPYLTPEQQHWAHYLHQMQQQYVQQVEQQPLDFSPRKSLSRPISSMSMDDRVFRDFPPLAPPEWQQEAAAVAAAASAEVAARAATYVLDETAEIMITEISYDDEDSNKENVPPSSSFVSSPSSGLASPSPSKDVEDDVQERESIRPVLYSYSPGKSPSENARFCMPTILKSYSEMAGRNTKNADETAQ
ncbi:hypothetical protein PRIPAC_87302, partial [Pristionchus pacificus]|uniref:BUB1 N-terminal domain-containing protein n=1 Tax=Pristionchus pacificus TaxID=54126 RepID=A0A2A6B9J3_PRIPA